MQGPLASSTCPDCGSPLSDHVCPGVPVMTIPATVVGRIGSRMVAMQAKPACPHCSKPGDHHNGTAIETAVMCLWRQWEQATQAVSPDSRNTLYPFSLARLAEVQAWAAATGAQYSGQHAAPRGRPRKLQPSPPAGMCPHCGHTAPSHAAICPLAAAPYPNVTPANPSPSSPPAPPQPTLAQMIQQAAASATAAPTAPPAPAPDLCQHGASRATCATCQLAAQAPSATLDPTPAPAAPSAPVAPPSSPVQPSSPAPAPQRTPAERAALKAAMRAAANNQ